MAVNQTQWLPELPGIHGFLTGVEKKKMLTLIRYVCGSVAFLMPEHWALPLWCWRTLFLAIHLLSSLPRSNDTLRRAVVTHCFKFSNDLCIFGSHFSWMHYFGNFRSMPPIQAIRLWTPACITWNCQTIQLKKLWGNDLSLLLRKKDFISINDKIIMQNSQ